MNDYQQKLIDIAKEYIRVCEKLNLDYYAVFGTCLGAVRHNGFIPWDDDMDFGMPRKDYEILAREGQKYLPENLFIQINDTDKEYYYPFMKIRDSNTTAIETVLKDSKINHGLWIDIFPFDGLPSDYKKIKRVERFDRCFVRRRFINEGYGNSFLDKIEKMISILLFPSKRSAFKKSVSLSKKYDFWSSNRFWSNWGRRTKGHKTKCFHNFISVKFETLFVRVPIDYDTYLSDHYGDWKTLPPIEKRKSWHSFALIDLDEPFTKYIK